MRVATVKAAGALAPPQQWMQTAGGKNASSIEAPFEAKKLEHWKFSHEGEFAEIYSENGDLRRSVARNCFLRVQDANNRLYRAFVRLRIVRHFDGLACYLENSGRLAILVGMSCAFPGFSLHGNRAIARSHVGTDCGIGRGVLFSKNRCTGA
jgi:hypothetical protein